ncbi:MAG: prolyl oligopeptidase family protein [Thermoanaerobaculia bacterium]
MTSLTHRCATLSLLALTAVACSGPRSAAPDYPVAALSDQQDDYFGVQVADPYRSLEELESEATNRFVEEQNALAQPYLESLSARQRLIERMTELWRYERNGLPQKRAGRYFFEYNDGSQEQDLLMTADGVDGKPALLIDPNTLRDDATISLASFEASPDGVHVAWGISDGGTDFRIWRVRNVGTGADLPEELRHMKFSGISWTPDSQGFYYSRYPTRPDGSSDDSKQVSVYHHRLGTPQTEDRHVYSIEDSEGPDPYCEVTDDGRFLIFNIFEGYSANAVHVQDLETPAAPVVRLLDEWDALYSFRGNRGRELFFETTHQAPNGRVVAIDLRRPEPASWREVVPEGPNVLTEAEIVGGRVIAHYLVDAQSRVLLFDLDGGEMGEITLPGIGTAGGFDGKIDDSETFFRFETFTSPRAVYRLDLSTGESSFFGGRLLEATDFETEQVFFRSKDGTRVPMFLIHRPGLERNGDNPTLLYGYGGFNIAETPEYRVRWTMWLEMGGVLAVANLRGGSEYGEAWHEAGTRTAKQNVFDDFIAAAEWLIAEGYTRTPRLAIHGRSNGGLLVGAVMTQRPELFGVALPAVGVLDMLRYHTASANAYQWGSDYGWSENENEFHALRAYSPLHNTRAGTCYPPTLLTTANRDDRVVPWHTYKFTAALQHDQGCDNAVLLRVETRAGHGGNKPTWMRIEDYADQWAFAAEHLGMEIPG